MSIDKSMPTPTIWSERLFSKFEKELGPCADQLGISREIFRRPDIEYSVDSYFKLLDCASNRGYPHIGHSVGATIGLNDVGSLGHALRASPTVGYGLGLAARYSYVFANGSVIRLDIGKDIAKLSYQLTEVHEDIPIQDIELSITFFCTAVRELSDAQLKPLVAKFEHPRPEYADRIQSFFGCEVLYNRTSNCLHFPSHLMNQPVPTADPSLLEALEFFLEDRLKARKEDDLPGKVMHLISISLSNGPPSLVDISKTLGISKRTLQRNLSETGLLFSDLVDDTRRIKGINYVKNSDFSLTDVARLLGYSELSAFSRAFRRWTGLNPQQVRKKPGQTETGGT